MAEFEGSDDTFDRVCVVKRREGVMVMRRYGEASAAMHRNPSERYLKWHRALVTALWQPRQLHKTSLTHP